MMGDKRSSRTQDPRQLISSRNITNGSGDDSCNVMTSESQGSFVAPLALSIDKLRFTSEGQQQRYSSIETPLPLLSSKGAAISSEDACSMESRMVENRRTNHLMKQGRKISSPLPLNLGMRNFIFKENAKRGSVVNNGSSPRQQLVARGVSDVQFYSVVAS